MVSIRSMRRHPAFRTTRRRTVCVSLPGIRGTYHTDHQAYSGSPPLTWFAEHMPDVQLPLAEGVRMNYWLSFPSGHTTSFFALTFAVCVLLTRDSRLSRLSRDLIQVLLFFAAALGGYSRIYLSQHFTADVFGGMLVGCLITIVCYAVFSRYKDKKWYNYRLIKKKGD